VNTPQRLRTFLMCTALCSTAMIAWSVVDYRQFVAEWSDRTDLREIKDKERWQSPEEPILLRHTPEVNGLTADGQEIWIFRLCGLGIFHDPNDLSLLIAVTAIIVGYFLLDRGTGSGRWLWLIPLGVMGTAYYYTFSRGGLLALGFAGVVWAATRYGGKVAVGLGLLGAAALPIAMGRHASMNLSDGTGQQRIQIWSEGLVQLKSFRGLFGIGEGMYPDLTGLVAHNSYVHSFVELGVFGGAIFFGCFYFPAYAFYRIKRDPIAIEHPELARMLPYIAAILAAWCMGMASLSRCYVAPTYMVVGVCAAYLNLVGYHRSAPRPLQTLNWRGVQRWSVCSAGLLACCFLFVKVFARYSG
ncbi:MAG: O-antigen ligase family protein, partial [Pirellulales bacterium]